MSKRKEYVSLPEEPTTLSAPSSQLPAGGAYDARRLLDAKKPVAPHVVSGAAPVNEGELALDIAMGRRSFERDPDA
jgi:hypothetical protein